MPDSPATALSGRLELRTHPCVRSAFNKSAIASSLVTTIPPSMVLICADAKLKLPITPKEPTFLPSQTTPSASHEFFEQPYTVSLSNFYDFIQVRRAP